MRVWCWGFGSNLKPSLAEWVPDREGLLEGCQDPLLKFRLFYGFSLRLDLIMPVVFRLKAQLCFDNRFS